MKIEIKKTAKPINYGDAIKFIEKRVNLIKLKKANELIWALEHPDTYTVGAKYDKKDILDKTIKIIKTNRGGKITYHGPGQNIYYFVIDLSKRKKDIKKFLRIIENTIIESLKEYKINSFNDPKNIGIWVNHENKIKKIAAIGIRISKWIAYHGFSINIDSNLNNYKKIVPCGIRDKDITNLKSIKNQNYNDLNDKIIKHFIKNVKI